MSVIVEPECICIIHYVVNLNLNIVKYLITTFISLKVISMISNTALFHHARAKVFKSIRTGRKHRACLRTPVHSAFDVVNVIVIVTSNLNVNVN